MTERNRKIVESHGVRGAQGGSVRSGMRQFGRDTQSRAARSAAYRRARACLGRRVLAPRVINSVCICFITK
jgi:hypothetical protein